MDSIFSDPDKVIQIIKALADPTRLGMLLNMNSNAPKGVTASRLADMLDKKIPTILHHLEKLQELGLAEYHMAENEAGRNIKHWRVVDPNFSLEIDLNAFSDAKTEIDIFILYLFEEEKRRNGLITIDYTDKNDSDAIYDKLNTYIREVKKDNDREISLIQAQRIHSRLMKKGELEKHLRIWILNAFKDSGASLQLDFFELGERFVLGQELRRQIYEYFIGSNKFSTIGYSDQGQPIQRLKLQPEYLDDPDL